MKAILITENFDATNLDKLNRDLKDCTKIIHNQYINNGTSTLLILENYTRNDKLNKINKISKENE